MAKKKEVTIPSWTMFGVHSVGLEIHQFTQDAKEKVTGYQVALTLFLDDGSPVPEETMERKVITIFTDLQSYDLDALIFEAASWVANAFENIGNHVFVLSEKGDILKEITLETFMNNYVTKGKKKSAKANSGATFH